MFIIYFYKVFFDIDNIIAKTDTKNDHD